MSTPTMFLLAVLGQQPAMPATKAMTPPPVDPFPAVTATAARVQFLRGELKKPGVSPRDKVKLKKQLVGAEARAREAREAAQFQQLQAAQQAYVERMMPFWLEQQRQNAQFSIEAAKAQAMQSMAATAERKRRDDLFIEYQRNQIEAEAVRRLGP